MECWKDIVGFERLYQISDAGNVKSLPRSVAVRNGFRVTPEKIIKPQLNSDGYLEVELHANNKVTKRTVHSLVAEAFIPNPCNLPILNHKDEDKQHNFANNLEWCTNNYNLHYGTITERKQASALCRAVIQTNKDGEFIQQHISLSAAARALGKNSASLIRRCCEGVNKTAYGFIFRYEN